MRRVDVLRGVDDVPAGVSRIDDVGRLDHRRQRDPPVGDVERVVGADAARRPQEHADDAEVAAVVGRCLFGQRRRKQPPCERREQRAQHVIELPQPAADDEPVDGIRRAGDLIDARAGMELSTELLDALGERGDQRLVAALEPAHDLATACVARLRHALRAAPDVGRRQVVVVPVELGVEQRLPEALDRSAPAELRQPGQQRDIVELFARRDEAAARDERGETHAVVQRQERERQELLGRAHREEPRVVVEADAASAGSGNDRRDRALPRARGRDRPSAGRRGRSDRPRCPAKSNAPTRPPMSGARSYTATCVPA